MTKRIHLVRSPTAGGGRRGHGRRELLERFEKLSCEVVDLTGPSAAASSEALATAVAAGDVEQVVVAGGDGMVHLAIQHLALTGIPLGILPSGTGNDFAKALGLGTADASATLSPTTGVDLMRVEDSTGAARWIGTVAITGFPASINARANSVRLPLGSAVYTIAAAIELPRFRRQVVELTIDGATISSDTAMLAVGNTAFFGGGMVVCPDADYADGLLHVTSIEGVGRIGILRHLARKSGGSADRPEVRRLVSPVISIATPGLDLWGDGEPVTTTPVTLEAVPHALSVAGVNQG